MNLTKYMRKKPIVAYTNGIKNSELKRTLGKWELAATGVYWSGVRPVSASTFSTVQNIAI